MSGISHTILPGPLHAINKGAMDWGPQRLLALGVWSSVMVVDLYSMKRVQTLDQHNSPVRKLKWATEQLQLHNELRYNLTLASGDQAGAIFVWKVSDATVSAALNGGGEEDDKKALGAVLDLEWHPDKPYLLASVHSPSSLVLWNVETSTAVWRHDFQETLLSLAINPFDKFHLCVASNLGWIYFVKDFKEEGRPQRIELKYRINAGTKTQAGTDAFQQMSFSPHHRNIVYFLLDRRILVFDLTIHQSVGSLSLERTKPSFRQLCLSKDREDLLFCLHEDGSLSAWKRRNAGAYNYDLVNVVDIIRVSRQTRKRSKDMAVTSISVAPINDVASSVLISLVSSDGVIWTVEWRDAVTLPSGLSLPSSMIIRGEMEGVTSAITSLAVYSPESEHLVASEATPRAPVNLGAIGTQDGRLLIVDLRNTQVTKILNVHSNFPLRGVKWITPSKLVCFTTESVDKTMYKNKIAIVDLSTGQIKEIRKKNEPEDTFIRGIRLSATKQYMIVLLKDQPFQVWELKSGSLLRSVTFHQITALEWSPNVTVLPNPNGPPTIREQFVFSTPDGALHFYAIENNQINATQMHVDVGIGVVSSLAWKDNLLVSGGTSGAIQAYNIDKKKLLAFETNKGLVRRIRFSPSPTSHQVLVLFNDGDFGIWDLDYNVRVAHSSYFRMRDLRAIDVDWVSESQPIIATTDGCVRIVDKTLSQGVNSPIQLSAISYPLYCPLLLPPTQALYLKAMLLHPELTQQGNASPAPGGKPKKPEEMITGLVAEQTMKQLVNLKDGSTAERALLVAKYFGNTMEIRFWTLALDILRKKQKELSSPAHQEIAADSSDSAFNPVAIRKPTSRKSSGGAATATTTATQPTDGAITIAGGEEEEDDNLHLSSLEIQNVNASAAAAPNGTITRRTSSGTTHPPETAATTEAKPQEATLPPFFDLLLDSKQLSEHYNHHSALHEQKRGTNYQLSQKIVDFNLMLGQKEKATELLLETNPENQNFYTDALRACVIAASISQTSFQNTVKLVATNLIANGNLDDGVQLLCLIGKSLEACRYLQSYDRWTEAALLAKLTLSPHDCSQVFRRWSDFLVSTNQLIDAIEVNLTLGEWNSVLYLLHKASLFDIASLFSKAAQEFGFLTQADLQVKSPSVKEMTMAQLLESIHLDYGFYLNRIGYTRAAKHFWQNQSGEAGLNMLTALSSSKQIPAPTPPADPV